MIKWIEIDSKIIKDNIEIIKSRLKNKKLMVVVKANGYGHGAVEVSKIASESNVDFLGVMNIYEASKIRKAGIKIPIMLLAPSLTEDIPLILRYPDIIPTIDDLSFAKELNSRLSKVLPLNLDIDMGLKRWGIDISKLPFFINELKKLKNLKLSSISTHIAYTPYKNMVDAKDKLEKFSEETEKIKKIFPQIIIHAANSLVFLDFPQFCFDMVRIGNLIYGIYPSDIYSKRLNSPLKLGIKRPWKFFAKIVSVKEVKKGETFGYASEIVAIKNMRIATIPVGYSDGLGMVPNENEYRITEGVKYWGKVCGKNAMFISKPAISHTLIDITDIPEANIGSVVELPIRRTAANSQIPRIYI
ncbi:MAG: alanine racemase [Elusimicrobiota bacterium]